MLFSRTVFVVVHAAGSSITAGDGDTMIDLYDTPKYRPYVLAIELILRPLLCLILPLFFTTDLTWTSV